MTAHSQRHILAIVVATLFVFGCSGSEKGNDMPTAGMMGGSSDGPSEAGKADQAGTPEAGQAMSAGR